MGGGDAVLVENLAVGGEAAVEIVAVPRRQPLGAIVRVVLRDVSLAGDHIGRADPKSAAALGHRLAGADHAVARGNAVARIDP